MYDLVVVSSFLSSVWNCGISIAFNTGVSGDFTVCPDKGIRAEFEFGDSQEFSSTYAKGETILLLSTVPILLESDGTLGTIAPLTAYYTVTLELFL